jgi:RNA polymerase sigma factor (TIGR02999 family)
MSFRIPAGSSKQISEILLQWQHGDRNALEAILPLVYKELHTLAQRQLKQHRSQCTLQTTALINEAYLRLAGDKSIQVVNRAHFIAIAAQLMRWILVDHERSRRALRRGAGATCVSLDMNMAAAEASPTDVDILALDQALTRLAALDEQQSRIVELRYFGGLSIEDTATSLGISPATVKRDWASARVWLLRELSDGVAEA